MKDIRWQINHECDLSSPDLVRQKYEDWFLKYYVFPESEPFEKNDKLRMIPGKIYYFQYGTFKQSPIPTPNSDLNFRRIFYCIGNTAHSGKLYAYGVDISSMRPLMRQTFLDRIIYQYEDVFDQLTQKIKDGIDIEEFEIPENFSKMCLEGIEHKISYVKYSSIYDTPKIITYKDWYKVCMLVKRFMFENKIGNIKIQGI